MNNFLIFCSGADKDILEQCPTPDIARYEGIGGTVFFTSLFAMLSGGYAFYFVFYSEKYALHSAVVLGIIWGLFIFNLDRYIVSSMNKLSSFWSDLRLAIPRLILAFFLAVVISQPLELKLFETEIERMLDKIEQRLEEDIFNRYKEKKDEIVTQFESNLIPLRNRVKQIKDVELINAIKEKDDFNRKSIGEKTGTWGTGKPGCGPNSACMEWKRLAEQKQQTIERLIDEEKELSEKFDKLEHQQNSLLARLDKKEQQEVSHLKQKKNRGFAARIQAFRKLTSEEKAVYQANLFITLLFIIIETAPIFVKLISNKGPYDVLLEKANTKAMNSSLPDKTTRTITVPKKKIQEPANSPEIGEINLKKNESNRWKNKYQETIRANQEKRKKTP